jgi:hypothetical protein
MLENLSDQDVSGAFATVLAGVMYVIRKLMRPSAQDRSDDSKLGYVDELRADNAKLRDEIDQLAKERNDAVARSGALEAQLDVYKGQCKTKTLILQHCPVINGGRDG